MVNVINTTSENDSIAQSHLRHWGMQFFCILIHVPFVYISIRRIGRDKPVVYYILLPFIIYSDFIFIIVIPLFLT